MDIEEQRWIEEQARRGAALKVEMEYLARKNIEEDKLMRVKMKELLGFELPPEFSLPLDFELPINMGGFHMLVQVYTRSQEAKLTHKDGTESLLVTPVVASAEDKYRQCTGLVLMQGPDCYKSDRFKISGPWCLPGNIIVFPRNEGTQIYYMGVSVQVIPDDRELMQIRKASFVTRE